MPLTIFPLLHPVNTPNYISINKELKNKPVFCHHSHTHSNLSAKVHNNLAQPT